MSFRIKTSELDAEWRAHIRGLCNVRGKSTKWNNYDPPSVCLFNVETINDTKRVSLPLSLWRDMFDEFPGRRFLEPDDGGTPSEFVGSLEDSEQRDQNVVITQAVKNLLTTRTTFLALRTGFGKTACAIYLVTYLRGLTDITNGRFERFAGKVAVLCHISELHQQWVDEFAKFAPSLKVQIVKNRKKSYNDRYLDPSADVYVMGIQKSTHIPKEEFEDVQIVIVDEVHKTLTQTFSSSLLRFTNAEFLIGLSATPDRPDGMHNMLYPYFGPKESFIVRTRVNANFRVIKYLTKYQPDVRYGSQGVDWTHVISSLATNEERQREIAGVLSKLCKDDPNLRFIAMSLRVCEVIGCKNYPKCPCAFKAPGIGPLLKALGCDVGYKAWQISENVDAQILLGVAGKIGTGFNDLSRNAIALLDDVSDVRQIEGRIRVDNNLLIDFVDDYPTFENKHYQARQKWYLKRGGKIEIWNRKKAPSI